MSHQPPPPGAAACWQCNSNCEQAHCACSIVYWWPCWRYDSNSRHNFTACTPPKTPLQDWQVITRTTSSS